MKHTKLFTLFLLASLQVLFKFIAPQKANIHFYEV